MRAPFSATDLVSLDERLLSRADRVVPMRDVFMGDTGAGVLGLRHDVDDNPGSFDTALRLAEWEFEHGYSSTYFLLHGSYYWGEEMFVQAPTFEELGHEVGIHVNAVAEALRQARPPDAILADALTELRSAGVRVVGSVAHGDALCGRARFVNDELFSECARDAYGRPDRFVEYRGVAWQLQPIPRSEYGLAYDANWLPRADYLSDSGGQWSQDVGEVCARFGRGQLHVLTHPDWWGAAFVREEVVI